MFNLHFYAHFGGLEMVDIFMFLFIVEKCCGIFRVCLVINFFSMGQMLNGVFGGVLTTEHAARVLVCCKYLFLWPLSL